jgi:FkbM family methyltransferase
MNLGGRSLGTIRGALIQRRHYAALFNMFRYYDQPLDMLCRYVLKTGAYPKQVRVRTPMGPIELTAFCADDVLTINEIFCRIDYAASPEDKLFVDFGSNIGISAAYFLSRSLDSYAYLFEPLEANIERLRTNLRPFEGRYRLATCAVGGVDGRVEFGWEDTGRYGGMGVRTGKYISVECRSAGSVIKDILERHDVIHVLKIDIETHEDVVVADIDPENARKIDRIYVEKYFRTNPFSGTHSHSQRGPISEFIRTSVCL